MPVLNRGTQKLCCLQSLHYKRCWPCMFSYSWRRMHNNTGGWAECCFVCLAGVIVNLLFH